MASITTILMDPQYDYLDGGSIPVAGGSEAIMNMSLLARQSDLVLVTRDWHPENHFTFSDDPEYTDQSWPPHCVQGTKGARVFPAIRKQADFIVSKGMNHNPPDEYSAFVGKTLRPVELVPAILYPRLTDIIVVAGFTLEIGVKFTAFDANASGWWSRVVIPLDCTGTLLPDDQADIITPLQKVGVEVVESWKQLV